MTQRRMGRWPHTVAALAVVTGAWMGAESQAAERSRTSRAKADGSTGTSAQPDKKLEDKLDQILANQEKIFQRFDEVMEELKIVKIRATIN
ncbi:MAG: hypothetical protein HYT90_01415 [Candidatus Omnitrophica bacterium]|nr:hypothetical protein [Candidatus Omnitrophota bacterium]